MEAMGFDATLDRRSLISIVLPAYNMGLFIGEALHTVSTQTHTQWEVIVVDDHASEDGTATIVHKFAAEHPQHRVELIRHEHNMGVSAARNTAIAASHGEFVAFLDPDDRWLPMHLERLFEQFTSCVGLDVATGPVEAFWDGPDERAAQVWAIAEWQIRSFPASLALNNFIQPSATLVRREALVKVGGFDTDVALQHIEDYDLWIRLVEEGARFVILKEHTSSYRKHIAAASSDTTRMRILHGRLYAKHVEFFNASRGTLTRTLFDRVDALHAEVVHLNIHLHGPIMRCILFLDRRIKRFGKILRGA